MAMTFVNNGGAQTLVSAASQTPPAVAVSASFWVQMSSLTPALQRFFGSSTDFEARIASTGIITNDFYTASDGAIAVTALSTGVRYHIVCTGVVSGGLGTTEIYINGVLNVTGPTITATTPATALLTVGNRTGIASTQGLNGILDDFRLYNRVLTAAEVRTIYAARGTDEIVNGLISRVLFDEGAIAAVPSGTGVIKDVSVTKNNFTPSGSPVFSASTLRFRRKIAS